MPCPDDVSNTPPVPGNRRKQVRCHSRFGGKFFLEFARQADEWGFPGFHAAAEQAPIPTKRNLGKVFTQLEQDIAGVVMDDGGGTDVFAGFDRYVDKGPCGWRQRRKTFSHDREPGKKSDQCSSRPASYPRKSSIHIYSIFIETVVVANDELARNFCT